MSAASSNAGSWSDPLFPLWAGWYPDLRYESYRMRNPAAEARLLASIAERGIEEALEGVDAAGGSILLNGFKRYQCAACCSRIWRSRRNTCSG